SGYVVCAIAAVAAAAAALPGEHMVASCYAFGALYWAAGLLVAWLSSKDPGPGNWPSALLVIVVMWPLAPLGNLLTLAHVPDSVAPLPLPSLHRLDLLPPLVWLLLPATGRGGPGAGPLLGRCRREWRNGSLLGRSPACLGPHRLEAQAVGPGAPRAPWGDLIRGLRRGIPDPIRRPQGRLAAERRSLDLRPARAASRRNDPRARLDTRAEASARPSSRPGGRRPPGRRAGRSRHLVDLDERNARVAARPGDLGGVRPGGQGDQERGIGRGEVAP